ncbi:hypothetical protein LCGC14_0327780 [marine sediment metagenome]|uniref:Uncharacterized protein n=1 Tax=marine sediment metagenome TaxID=412755 RepID=A0A0F9W4S0_9ZZZZ
MTGIETGIMLGTYAVTAGDVMMVASTLIGVVGQMQQASAQQAAGQAQAAAAAHRAAIANRQAQVMEQQAGQERAVSQRAAQEERRRGRFVSSRVQALSAASGAGALDPTIVGILGDIGTEEETRALTALYEGEERARGLEYGATLERAGGAGALFAGQAARRAGRSAAARSRLSAAGTLLEGGSSLFAKYSPESPTGGGSTYYTRRSSRGGVRRYSYG